MIVDPEELTAVLAGTSLAHLPVGHGPRGTLLIADVPEDLLDESWQQARDLLPATGRWPVLVLSNDEEEEYVVRPDRDPEAPTEAELREFAEATLTVDPWPAFLRYADPEEDADNREWFDEAREGTGSAAQADTALRLWLDRDHNPYDATSITIVLLPTALPWMAPIWIWYLGADGHDDPVFGAALRQWHERYGAGVRCGWFGIQLTFDVARPPAPGEQAWDLSGQIHALTTDLNIARWETALALPEARTWKLFDRP